MNLNLLAKAATTTGLNMWPWNSPVFSSLTWPPWRTWTRKVRHCRMSLACGAQDQWVHRHRRRLGAGLGEADCVFSGTELQSGKKNKPRKYWRWRLHGAALGAPELYAQQCLNGNFKLCVFYHDFFKKCNSQNSHRETDTQGGGCVMAETEIKQAL